MPFSKKISFVEEVLPSTLPDDSGLFYCEPTQEAFMHYDDFCTRVIQCNSLIWTDTVSGKSDLTYLEALESERESATVLASLPDSLHVPVLYLASIAQCSSLEKKLKDVYNFIEYRFFVGETVQFFTAHDNAWKKGIVSQVIAPSEEEIEEIRSSVQLLDGGEFFPPPTHYLYKIESSDGSGNKYTMGIPLLKRPTGTWTKEIAENFLEHFIIQDEDKWLVDRGVMDRFNIPSVKFDDFYDGDAPIFPLAQIRKVLKPAPVTKKSIQVVKKRSNRKYVGMIRSKKSESLISKQDRKNMKQLDKSGAINGQSKEKLQQTDIKNYFRSSFLQEGNQRDSESTEESFCEDLNGSHNKSTDNDTEDNSLLSVETDACNIAVPGTSSRSLSTVSKRKVRGTYLKKGKQLRITGDGRLEDVERKSKYGTYSGRKASPIEKGREKLRKEKKEQAVLEGFQLHEERLRMKAKQEEEKLQFAKFMKEWRKKREDLECEDLKPLPVPHRINSNIPNHLFGDFVMILEFLNSFHDFLKVKSYIPGGVSLEVLERALVENEIAGPLHNILCMFLNSIFECQTTENENQLSVDNLDELYGRTTSNNTGIDYLDPTGLCDTFRWCETFLGVSIQEVDLTPLSVSEILRLHLLGSGGRHRSMTEWLSNCDDPIFWFRREHSPILLRLRKQHVCELPVAEKLTILSCLMNEILAYTQVRDMVDDRGEQMRMAKVELRALEIAELKLQKEATAKRIQNKRTAKLLRLKGELTGKSNTQLTKHQKDAEIEKLKIEKEISKLKTDIQKKQNKILPLIMKHQLHPIGSDRAHRNFWLFSSLPGLFVECCPFEVGPCLPQPTPLRTEDRGDIETHVRKLFQQGQNNNSDKENDISDGELSRPPCSPNKKMLAEQNVSVDTTNCSQYDKEMLPKEMEEKDVPQYEYLICTADNKCPVHCLPISMSCWSFFSNPDDVVLLLDSLNERGVRESDLKRAMTREQERIKESISSCPLQKLSASKFLDQELRKSTRNSVCYKPEVANMNFPLGTPVKKIMESVLRDTILEMESKITLGCLGVLKVQDRAAWRLALEKGDYDPQCERLVWGFPKCSPHGKGSGKKDIVSDVLKTCVDNDEMERSMSKDESCSETPNEQCAINTVCGWNVTNVSDLNMIEIEGDKQEAEKEGHSSNQYIKNIESPDHSSSNSNVDSHVEMCADNLPSGGLDENACEEIKETDSLNFMVNDFNSPSKDEANLSSLKGEEEVEGADDKVQIEVNEKVNSLGRETILMEMPHKTQIINNLAAAILQLGQSVDPKFLIKPLADNDNEECPLQIKYWETSVMTAINFSQLFLYQFILDRSINWSKSILRMPCRICRRRGEPETMVSCLKCHKRYHHKCTNTKDFEIPKDSWICPFCSEEYVPKPSRAKKRKNDNTKPECNEVLLNNSPERKSARLVCHKCGISGEQLINCSSCSKVFHSNCLNPHLRGNLHQEENWLCDTCKTTKESNSSDAELAHEDSDETPGRGRRVCASATMAKIASFAKRLRSRSWDDDEATSDCSTSTRFSSEYVHSGHRSDSPIRRSSRRADFISESLPLDNAVLQNLLDEMIHHEDSWPFLRPVRKSEVPDYHQYIKKPMDLGTIKYKLNTAEYKNNYDFVVDTLLVFENCFMYNSSETAVYKCGVEMSQFFKKRCQELGLMENGISDESEILMA